MSDLTLGGRSMSMASDYPLYHVLLARLVVAAMRLPMERRRTLFNRWRFWVDTRRPELFKEADRHAGEQISMMN